MSTETRLGQAAPLVEAMEAILAACPPVAEVEAVELLRRGTRLPGGGSYVRVLLCV